MLAMTRGEDTIERWVQMLGPILNSYMGRDTNMSSLRACTHEAAPEEDSEISVGTVMLVLGRMLQTTTEYENISAEVTASLSNVAGYISACAVLTRESAVMKEDLSRRT